MLKRLLVLLILLAGLPLHSASVAGEVAASPRIQEEIWELPFPLPVLAFVVKPVGDGPFPLLIMNHGIALGLQERTMFPTIEYRAAARWFANQGYSTNRTADFARKLPLEKSGLIGCCPKIYCTKGQTHCTLSEKAVEQTIPESLS